MPARCCARCRPEGVAVHELAATVPGILPRARWLRSLLTFAVLAFALLSVEEADARLAGRTRLTTAESVIGSSRLAAVDARADEVSPCAAQPAYPVGSLGGLFSRPGLIGG